MAKKKKSGRGGARPNSGRPRKHEAELKQIFAYVPADLLVKADELAKARGLTRSEAVVKALAAWVEREELPGSWPQSQDEEDK